jgi:hypothetical protein
MELLAELSAVPGHQDRHHAVLRRRPPVPRAAVRRRRLPAEGRPLRSAGRGVAEDRARPAAAVARHRPAAADALPPRRGPAPGRGPSPDCAGRSSARALTPLEVEVLTYRARAATIKAIARCPSVKPLDHERLTAARERGAGDLPEQGLHDQGDREPDGHQVVHRQRPHQVHLQEAQRVQPLPKRAGAGQQAGPGAERGPGSGAAGGPHCPWAPTACSAARAGGSTMPPKCWPTSSRSPGCWPPAKCC